MSAKCSFLLDIDGVVGSFVEPAVATANRLFGTKFDADKLDQWDIARWMGLTNKQEEALYAEYKKPGFHDLIKPYPGAVEGVMALKEIANITVVTSPMIGPTWCSERWDWLEHYLKIKPKDVFHCYKKHMVKGDILLDDKPSNIKDWSDHWPNGFALLWHQPYNVSAGNNTGLRTLSWDQVFKLTEVK